MLRVVFLLLFSLPAYGVTYVPKVQRCRGMEYTTKYGVKVFAFVKGGFIMSKMAKKDATRLALREEFQNLKDIGLCP